MFRRRLEAAEVEHCPSVRMHEKEVESLFNFRS